MLKSDFSFILPTELIAQKPLENRDSSRLLCMDRSTGQTAHKQFLDLPELLHSGDCLVLNDTRVLLARLYGSTKTGGSVEVLLLNSQLSIMDSATSQSLASETCYAQNDGVGNALSTFTWECLVRPGKKMKTGTKLYFGDNELTATVTSVLENGNRIIEFECVGEFLKKLEVLGNMPLPPYIHEHLEDAERYQTVYSREIGSAAAPTAGLHFTHELLDKLRDKGIEICYITLHVGLGTFRPVKTEKIEDHIMHPEYYTISKQTADVINRIKENNGRIIAVGTTSCRVLETVSDLSGGVGQATGHTDIFIYPGYTFKCIDGLITNFHLPESTLIMLVSALAGREQTLSAYKEAIEKKYRFYSFGDAMLLL